MINQELLDYVKQQLQQGVSKEQIKGSLMGNGWQESDINEAFMALSAPSIPVPPATVPSGMTSFQPKQPQQSMTSSLGANIKQKLFPGYDFFSEKLLKQKIQSAN